MSLHMDYSHTWVAIPDFFLPEHSSKSVEGLITSTFHQLFIINILFNLIKNSILLLGLWLLGCCVHMLYTDFSASRPTSLLVFPRFGCGTTRTHCQFTLTWIQFLVSKNPLLRQPYAYYL